ncbi:hypothetical protein [Polaribacter septentrionalilitoris]|uniref:hypothetical protein n=1 Tax=Polaribacter septentrionalilitoris TaxID=2494657 RepID=UPI001F420ADC|nr:hypothetical protein [Polaribacter septentrionalilitoris]
MKKRISKYMLQNDIQIKSGVVGGTLLSTVFTISLDDILFTIIMAIIGAIVSFSVSTLLKWLFFRKQKKNT